MRRTMNAAAGILALTAMSAFADPPTRNGDAMVVLDFLTAQDGALDSPDDILLDADPCDPSQPDLLETVVGPDGELLTLRDISSISGMASVNCQKTGTQINLQLSGLLPNGVYTVWLLVFEAPGFTLDFANLVAEGVLGAPDGSSSTFVAGANGKASLTLRHSPGPLSIAGEVGSCLMDQYEFHLVGAYHPDGLTYGPTPGPVDENGNIGYCYFIEHFGFVFHGVPVADENAGSGRNMCADYGTGTSCEGVPINSSCLGGGRCSKYGDPLEPHVYNCFCKPKGPPCRRERCWR